MNAVGDLPREAHLLHRQVDRLLLGVGRGADPRGAAAPPEMITTENRQGAEKRFDAEAETNPAVWVRWHTPAKMKQNVSAPSRNLATSKPPLPAWLYSAAMATCDSHS